jgi:uncharacterized protein (TIGR02246 family)
MDTQTVQLPDSPSAYESLVRALYERVLAAWNRRVAGDFAAQFEEDGNCIGFDGSLLDGRAEIAASLRQIFADHVTPPYVWKIRFVRFLHNETALLRAIVGMAPPGQTDLNPALNSIQTMLAVKRNGQWWIAQLQTTPAQFHGRPDLVKQMTDELQQLRG